MDPRDLYKAQRHVSWSRVEMLLALYEGAIQRIRQSMEAAQSGDEVAAYRHRMHAVRIVLEMRAGLNLDLGELPRHVDRLLEFVLHRLAQPGASLADGLEVLSTLREGFEGIREEAIRLEREGAIPPVEESGPIVRRA